MQTDKRYKVFIADDNTPGAAVDDLVKDFAQTHPVVYSKSNITDTERPRSCRYSAAINILMRHVDTDIVMYSADDQEIASPNLVGRLIEFYEQNPQVGAGYVGMAYRLADFRTGEILTSDSLAAEAKILSQRFDSFRNQGVIFRSYPDWVGYGGKLNRVFAVIDSCQFSHRRKNTVMWDEDPRQWMGADAVAMQQICHAVDGVYPIGDPNAEILMYSNLNESSLTVQGSAEKSIEILK